MQEKPKLTDRQQQILDLVQSAIERTGAPPTRAEIAAELGFKSANAAEEHLQALARKGVIELVGGTADERPLVVPVDAIATIDGQTVVFLVGHEPNSFEVQPVALGRRAAGLIEVRSGLDEGAELAVSGAFTQRPEQARRNALLRAGPELVEMAQEVLGGALGVGTVEVPGVDRAHRIRDGRRDPAL